MKSKDSSKVQILRRQFPLRAAACKTIHRSQGDTFDEVVVDFPAYKKEHMHYVGLSRVRNTSALHILNLNENKIKVSEEVKHEMSRLRTETSSIGDGGIGTKCAETTTRKKCAKIPRSNISGMCGISGMPRSNFPRSNGKIKMGKIPRSNISGMSRSNAKVKNFRNVWNVRNVKTENSQKICGR